MNTQNLLKYYGSKLNLVLDSSEFHDFEIAKTELDYDPQVLDFTTPITYGSLVINTTGLTNADCFRNTISLIEFDNSINDSGYTYSAFTWTLPYNTFTNQLNNSDLILQNDVYGFVDVNGNNHYFTINGYNNPLSNPYNLNILGFSGQTGATLQCTNLLSGTTGHTVCCPQDIIPNAKPWAYQINHGGGSDNCSYVENRREENGWTLDFVLNKSGHTWSDGGTFYYFGVRNENDVTLYADNNLSFSFTSGGTIVWNAVHYSGICDPTTGYSETYYIASGSTPVLCSGGTSSDFNITITFKRYKDLTDCNLQNDGGWNDMILGNQVVPYSGNTGDTMSAVTTTQVVIYDETEKLNKKWFDSRGDRLGVLKIYLNGQPIYKLIDFEEVIPSTRGNQPFIQSWAGGTQHSGGIHNKGVSCFNFKQIQYYSEPLNFEHVKHKYLSSVKPNFNINECNSNCSDNLFGFSNNVNITLHTTIKHGSILFVYDLSFNQRVTYDLTISFKNKVRFLNSTYLTIPISFTVPKNNLTFQYTHTENNNYDDLDFNFFEFFDLSANVKGGVTYSAVHTFTFTPKFDLVYEIIPDSNSKVGIVPNGNLHKSSIFRNFNYDLIPNSEPNNLSIPNDNLTSFLYPNPSPSPSPSHTPTPSCTPSLTTTPSITPTLSLSVTSTPSFSVTPSVSMSITPTKTITPSVTPSITPSITTSVTPSQSVTPSPTPSTPVYTGYGYILVVLPYNPPTSGNTIFPALSVPGASSGITNPNTFSTNGVYWNVIDISGIDRTSFYSGLTGNSVSISFTQNGNTVTYSGSSTSFQISGGQIYYNPNITPNQLNLTQPSPSNFTTGQTVYISYSIIASPTPTPTTTTTPTTTSSPSIVVSNSPTPSITPSVTPSKTITPTPTPSITPTHTVSITPTVTPSITKTPTVTPSFVCTYVYFTITNNTSQVINGVSYFGQNLTYVSGQTYSSIVNGGSGTYKTYYSNNSVEPFYVYFGYPFLSNVYAHVTDSSNVSYCTQGGGNSQTNRIDIYASCSGNINIVLNNTPC